jgi:hypothetical protein
LIFFVIFLDETMQINPEKIASNCFDEKWRNSIIKVRKRLKKAEKVRGKWTDGNEEKFKIQNSKGKITGQKLKSVSDKRLVTGFPSLS